MKTKILFLVPYPLGSSPSQRFRFEQYFDLLQSTGHEIYVSSFLGRSNPTLFSESGNASRKVLSLIRGFLNRFKDLAKATFFDFIFIHREACPIGPPVFEWILRFVLKKKIIYDFDDAIWLTDRLNESSAQRILKCRSKVKYVCRWSYKVSCSNEYLRRYALNVNKNTFLIPTTVDTVALHNTELYQIPKQDQNELVIGWTGSCSTLKYLSLIEDVIADIQKQYRQVILLVIADKAPSISIPYLRFKKWDINTEIEDLLKIDIGVMPLPDDPWTRGKGGFKCLQYMALEIPAVASCVGVNSMIVDHGINGFLANDKQEWKNYLVSLIEDRNLRKSMGNAGRMKIEKHYSVTAHSATFLSLFR